MEVSEDVPEDSEASLEGLVVLAIFDAGPESDIKVRAGMTGYGWNYLGHLLAF